VYRDEQAQEDPVSSSATVEFPLTVTDEPAQDVDGDDSYEEIDGDGEFGLDDVQAVFENRNSDIVESNPELFNFDGQDGSGIALSDVQALYRELLE